MKINVGALLGGLLFGIGLAVAGMTQPAKIIGFFDLAGSWDPSLGFVMGGAVLIYAPIYRTVMNRWSHPIWAGSFSLPTRKDIDWRLLSGSALFGVGWGLGGYCPGPALTSIGGRSHAALVFGAAMLVGVGGYQVLLKLREARTDAGDGQATPITDG